MLGKNQHLSHSITLLVRHFPETELRHEYTDMDPTIGMIVLGVVFVAALVFAFLGSKAWHWGHIAVLMSVLIFSALAMLLTAESLRIRTVYESKVANKDKEREQLELKNRILNYGTLDEDLAAKLFPTEGEDEKQLNGIITLKNKMEILSRLRGRVWRRAQPIKKSIKANGEITVTIPAMVSGEEIIKGNQIEKDMKLFVFEDGGFPDPNNINKGKHYIGEFQVTNKQGDKITIRPRNLSSWDGFQKKRFQKNSKDTWSLYNTMPSDQHAIWSFPELSPEERLARLKLLIPKTSLESFVRDGSAAKPGDAPLTRIPYTLEGRPLEENKKGLPVKEDGVTLMEAGEYEYRYVRPLNDYATLFSTLALKTINMLAKKDAVSRDIERINNTIQLAKQDQTILETEQNALQFDLVGFQRDRKAAVEYQQAVESRNSKVKARLAKVINDNQRLAAKLAAIQLDLLKKHNPAPVRGL